MEPNWIQQRAYLTPNRVGLSFEQARWTFRELSERANQLAGQLQSFGITRGDRVAIIAPSTPELVFVIYGCMMAQVEMVFLNSRLSKAEIQHQLEDAAVAITISHEATCDKLPEEVNYVSFTQLLEAPPAPVEVAKNWLLQQTISIMYTSGTTGFPKGVRQTLQNHQSSALSSALNIGLTMNDTWLCTMPIFHISGFSMLMKSLLYGVEIRLYEKFDADDCTKEIASGNITYMSVVAVTLGRMLDVMEAKGITAHPNFKLLLAGGGPIPVDYLQRAARLQLQVAQTYGMTETASQTATLGNEDALRKLGSAGKPLFFNEIQIAGAQKPYDEGEILIRGPHVTPGYIGRFAELQAQMDGWLHSGDIGYLDEEGYLFVVDRRADLIISGGENVYPAEIENTLLGHPAILEAGVCGVPSEQWGQVPVAFIVLKEGIDLQQLRDYCLANLAKYKVPHNFYIVSELPRNGSNKLMRRKLPDLL